MEVKDLNSVLEPIFWKKVNQDVHHYHFFAFDWKYHKEKTRILLALEGTQINGMMLVFDGRIAQLRGKLEVAEILLANLDLETVELQSPLGYKEQVLRKYNPTISHEMILMLLNKREEKLDDHHQTAELDKSDAEQIANLMRKADPQIWGSVTEQRISERMDSWNWLGIKLEGSLVAIGSSLLTEWTGHIGVVATQEEHRNRGYATSIVSKLASQILKENPTVIIHVLKENHPAFRVYRKVGFRPYRSYFFIRGQKRVSK